MRLAAEIAERLDAIIVLPEPLETLDRPVLFLVAGGALGIWRATQRAKAARRARMAAKLAAEHVQAATERAG